MNVPFHPLIAHFPLILACILPPLVLIFAFMMRDNKMAPSAWLVIIGLQLVTTITGYVAIESGREEEERVEKVVEKRYVQDHEAKAEVFVGITVLALAISIAIYFIKKDLQFLLQLIVFIIGLVACYFGYKTGHLGGELVYVHGAGTSYHPQHTDGPVQGLLPTPGLNTSESEHPTESNESLKPDENDYGNGDESEESDGGEDLKQED